VIDMELVTILQVILTAVWGGMLYMMRELIAHLRARDQFEHQAKFSWAHKEQAEAIKEMHAKLSIALKKVSLMTSPVQFGAVDRHAQRKEAADAYDALDQYFATHQLLLTEKRAQEVEKLITMMRTSFNEFVYTQNLGPNADNLKMAIGAWKRIEEEAQPVLTALRKDFRTALTVEG